MEHKTVSVPNNFYFIVQKYNFGETKLFGYQWYKPDISLNYFADLSHIPLENWQKTKNFTQRNWSLFWRPLVFYFDIIWRLRTHMPKISMVMFLCCTFCWSSQWWLLKLWAHCIPFTSSEAGYTAMKPLDNIMYGGNRNIKFSGDALVALGVSMPGYNIESDLLRMR